MRRKKLPAMTEGPAGYSFAPAKINLYLHVTGRRADGYHLLDSLIAFAGIGDGITVEPAPALSLAVEGPFAADVPTGPGNLVLEAAAGLARVYGVSTGAAIRLDKRLPVASGIGGGSADAAATLRALARLWEVPLETPAVAALALELGADVPVCLKGGTIFVSGIGENLVGAPALPEAWLVLANPGVGLSTPAVFAARAGEFSAPARFTRAATDAGDLASLLAERGNDLAAAARALTPAVGATLAALEAEDGVLLARMSGSGATCFALYAEEAAAAAAAARLGAAHPTWWVAAAPLLA